MLLECLKQQNVFLPNPAFAEVVSAKACGIFADTVRIKEFRTAELLFSTAFVANGDSGCLADGSAYVLGDIPEHTISVSTVDEAEEEAVRIMVLPWNFDVSFSVEVFSAAGIELPFFFDPAAVFCFNVSVIGIGMCGRSFSHLLFVPVRWRCSSSGGLGAGRRICLAKQQLNL